MVRSSCQVYFEWLGPPKYQLSTDLLNAKLSVALSIGILETIILDRFGKAQFTLPASNKISTVIRRSF